MSDGNILNDLVLFLSAACQLYLNMPNTLGASKMYISVDQTLVFHPSAPEGQFQDSFVRLVTLFAKPCFLFQWETFLAYSFILRFPAGNVPTIQPHARTLPMPSHVMGRLPVKGAPLQKGHCCGEANVTSKAKNKTITSTIRTATCLSCKDSEVYMCGCLWWEYFSNLGVWAGIPQE